MAGTCRWSNPGDFFVHEVVFYGQTGGGAHPGYPGKHADLFLELLNPGLGFGRIVAVIKIVMDDFTAVDAAIGIDHFEIRIRAPGNSTPGRGRAGLGSPLTDVDLGVGNAFFCGCIKAEAEYCNCHNCQNTPKFLFHGSSPIY